MTREEFLNGLKLPLGATVEWLHFIPEITIDSVLEPMRQAAHVKCQIEGNTLALALEGAKAILARIDGLETYIRVPPEAKTHKDFASDETIHVGYVRFSFFDRPGEAISTQPPKISGVGFVKRGAY